MIVLLVVLTVLEVGNKFSDTAIATIIASVVAGGVGLATKRSGDQANIRVSEITTRGEIEEAAFERAKAYYTDVIDRQAKTLNEQAEKITRLESRVNKCEQKVDYYRRTAQRLARGVDQLRRASGRPLEDAQLDEAVLDMLSADDDT